MNEHDKATIEIIRAAFRPILILFLGIGSLIFLTGDITGEWVDWWHKIFLFGGGEWILERPIIKLAGKVRLNNG